MEDLDIKIDLKVVKSDLRKGIKECSQRGLVNSAKWLAELNYSLSYVKLDTNQETEPYDDEFESYSLAKTYFDSKEYDRCAFFTESCKTPKPRFLHLYAKYLAGEKRKIENMTENSCPPDPSKDDYLRTLLAVLKTEHAAKRLDGYGLYLYGVVLKKLDLPVPAVDIFIEAIHATPLNWSAWAELSPLVTDRNKLTTMSLPDHWIKYFFLAHSYLEQLCNTEALEIYFELHRLGFEKSSYVTAQIALSHHNKRELEKAIELFRSLQKSDPYRLDNLDTYSNILYVKEMQTELASLAHRAVEIDKYRVETCCVIGNYYSLRSEHQKAVVYFQRALRLNPQYLSAWTLMGHEYMEMKNTNAAIQSYRQAIEVNKRDYRAWYGLGQTYEIMNMPFYGLYYYKQASYLRPQDSRMLIAVGETYEKLEKIENALKCYYKACNVGDIEGVGLIKLARLYDKLNDSDNAAAVYTEYCLNEPKTSFFSNQSELYSAYRYLANYHLKKGQLEDAYTYAYKCLEHEDTKEEGKALLKTIAAKRGQQEIEFVMDETCSELHPGDTTT